MAETTVFAGSTPKEPPPITEKKPIGRPRKDGQPPGTPPIATVSEPEDFFLSLPAITAEEWNFRMLYLYRLYPITDRRGAGQPVYLNKFSEAVDRDRIMRDYGSGIYKLELLQTIPNERGKKLAACLFQIMNQDYPPKVQAGEWVNDPRNADWEWCRPKLGPGSLNGASGSTADDIAAAVVKVHRELTPPKSDETPGLLAAIMPLLDPNRQLETMRMFAEMTKSDAPKQDDGILKVLLTMLMDDRKAMREELAEIRKQASSAAGPQKSAIETALEEELLKRIARNTTSSGPHLDGWAAVLDKAVDKLGPAVGTVGTLLAQRMMMPPPQAPPPQAPRPTVVQTTAQTLPAPAEQPVQQQNQQQPTKEENQDVNTSAVFQKYSQALQQALPFMIDKFKEDPADGYECRDWFCSPKRFGNVVWDGMRTEIGVEQFISIAKGIPQVWTAFQPEDRFRKFLTEFFTVIGEEDPSYFEDDEEEETEGKHDAA